MNIVVLESDFGHMIFLNKFLWLNFQNDFSAVTRIPNYLIYTF